MSILSVSLEYLFQRLRFRDTQSLLSASTARQQNLPFGVDEEPARDPDEAEASFRKAIHLIDENLPSSFGL